MSLPRRYLLASLSAGVLITAYYLHYIWSISGSPSGRTPQGHLLGMLGFAAIIGSLFCSTRQRQGAARLEVWYYWHLMLGGLSVWLILIHASFRFGNVIATLAFVFLAAVAMSGIVIDVIRRKVARLNLQEETPLSSSTQLRYDSLLQICLSLHLALTSGLMMFSLIHILSILYY